MENKLEPKIIFENTIIWWLISRPALLSTADRELPNQS